MALVQAPEESIGTFIGVLIFSFACLIASSLMIWLVWTHHERDSFVGLLSYFTFLSTVTSIIQQLHTMIWWDDVKTQQWEHARENIGSVEIAIAGPSVGIDLVLFYIQYFAYNVEALLALCWAGALAQSIFGFADIASLKRIRHRTNNAAKILAVLIPAILINLLQLPAVRNNYAAFIIVANINMMISLTFGALLLLTILGKYIHTRRQFLSWNVQYGNSTGGQTQSPARSGEASRRSIGQVSRRSAGIYDRWLMTRFAFTFIMLGIFEILLIFFQIASAKITMPPDAPDLSAEKAIADDVLFMPGCSASMLLFIVFGTTTPFRAHMRKTFLPRFLQRETAKSDPHFASEYSGQTGKSLGTSVHTTDAPPMPANHGAIMQLREIEMQREYSHKYDDDEYPILKNTTRVNDEIV